MSDCVIAGFFKGYEYCLSMSTAYRYRFILDGKDLVMDADFPVCQWLLGIA
jgi:hypothetical protein